MRKLTKNELIELRACKEMDNAQEEFFTRAKRMYAGDTEALAKISETENLFREVSALDNTNDGDSKTYQGYNQANLTFLEKVDSLLQDMGYVPKPKPAPNDIFDILEEMFGTPDESEE